MRKFEEHGDLNVLTPEVFSVLQLCAANEPLLPNLNALALQSITTEFIPFIPLFLSPRTTTIAITSFPSDPTKAMVASMITTFLTLCPDLQDITIVPLPRDPTIAAAVSEMLLASNPNTLRHFWVDSPLTKEACEVISELPSLRKLLMVIEKDATLPPAVLPNLAQLSIKYDRDDDWLPMFQGAALEKLEAVMFIPGSERIGGFLEAFERAGLAASIENTLSTFYLFTSCSWNPNYSSLLSFGQLTNIIIEFACHNGCSSRVDDDIITNLAQTMPKLQALFLGDPPCHEIPFGVTVEGLVALADHCPDLLALRVHFRVATLSALSVTTPNARSTTARRDCALKELEVGEIPMSEESVLMVALTLALIFPHVHYIDCTDENWEKVVDAIRLSRQIVGYPGKELSLSAPRSNLVIPP